MTMKQFKEKYEKRKRVKGVSMVSLVITIIVILILTAIVFVGSMKTIDEADYSKYVSNVSDVSTAFREASTAVNGDKTAEGNQKNEEQVYNYVANAGNKEEDFLVPNEIPRYTIIKDDARIGIKLPEMKVESGTGKRVIAQYATTKKGVIFTWPPYNYGDELHITDKDTVEHKMQTTITVGDETFEIELNPIDGTLKDLPVIPVQPGGGGNEDNIDPDEPEEPVVPPHEHVFSSQTVTHEYLCSAATCTSAATYYYKCIGCAEKGTSTYTSGNALGHDYSSKNTSSTYLKSQATCTSPAEYYYKCVSCTQKGTETYTHGAKGNHSFGGYTTEKEANCSETGSQKRTCTKCNTIETAVIPKDASKHANIVETVLTEASCTTAGLKKVYCDSCDTVINEETIASKGHNFVGVTCTTGGTCSNCGATTVALGHDWNSATPRVCKRCGAVDEVVHYNLIPEGATYIVGIEYILDDFDCVTLDMSNAITYYEGEPFPETTESGHMYTYGDYTYVYNAGYNGYADWTIDETLGGWGARVNDTEKTVYEPVLNSINGLPLKSMECTYWYCENMTQTPSIPETVVNVEATFLYCENITEPTEMPSGITSMNSTFGECSKLKAAPVIPSGVTNMWTTFDGCMALEAAPLIPDGVNDMFACFSGCNSMRTYHGSTDLDGDFSNYSLPSGITDLWVTFSACKSMIVAPKIPDSVTNMRETFRNCTSLKSVSIIPKNVTNMEGTFSGCDQLSTYHGSVDSDGDLSNYKIPSNVKNLKEAFDRCNSIVKAPNMEEAISVTDMTAAFDSADLLEEVATLPPNVQNMDECFWGCTNLKTVSATIPSTVNRMSYTFATCNSLTGIIYIDASIGTNDNSFNGANYCFSLHKEGKDIILAGKSTTLKGLAKTSNSQYRTIYDIDGNVLY